jgi:hypothetical protein
MRLCCGRGGQPVKGERSLTSLGTIWAAALFAVGTSGNGALSFDELSGHFRLPAPTSSPSTAALSENAAFLVIDFPNPSPTGGLR